MEKNSHDLESRHSYNKPRKVKLTVEKVTDLESKGPCHLHKVGETFSVDFERCPANFCAAAWHSLWPSLRVVELGGRHPWDAEKGITYACCPDPNRPVVFKIETFEE